MFIFRFKKKNLMGTSDIFTILKEVMSLCLSPNKLYHLFPVFYKVPLVVNISISGGLNTISIIVTVKFVVVKLKSLSKDI